MKYIQTKSIDVTPFLFNALAESNAAKAKAVIEGFDGLIVINSFRTEGCLVVLVSGSVGNREDYVVRSLNNSDLPASIAADSTANKIINSEIQFEYSNLNKDLSSSWD